MDNQTPNDSEDWIVPAEFFGLEIVWTDEASENDGAASPMYYEELVALCLA